MAEVHSWITGLKCQYQLAVERIGLSRIRGWSRRPHEIVHDDGQFFGVMATRVRATNREVSNWDQPLVRPVEKGMIALVAQEINGLLHFLVQGKVEPGSPDTLAIGPTVQRALGPERVGDPASWPLFAELAINAPPESIRYSCTQSEEGGRFYHVENEYRLVQIDESLRLELPDNYLWLTLRQINELLRYGLVNVEARSLLACLNVV
jgi:oxidase EvaA